MSAWEHRDVQGVVQDVDEREAIEIAEVPGGYEVTLYHGCPVDADRNLRLDAAAGSLTWWAEDVDAARDQRDELREEWGAES